MSVFLSLLHQHDLGFFKIRKLKMHPAPTTANHPVIRVSDLSYKASSDQLLIDAVNFELHAGENLVIVGPNGSGKSTLLKLLTGTLTPSQGEVVYSNTPLQRLTLKQRAAKIAVIDQHEKPDPRLLVRDYVRLGCIPHEAQISKEEITHSVEHAMSLLGISHLSGKTMQQLSGGEKQKTYVARSLCQKPDVLILDEPTNHLDPKAKGEVLSIVASLGITTITVLHELPLAAQMCDKLLLLESARVRAFGTPDQALTTELVHQVFGVGLHRFEHPQGDRSLVCIDIPMRKNSQIMEFI